MGAAMVWGDSEWAVQFIYDDRLLGYQQHQAGIFETWQIFEVASIASCYLAVCSCISKISSGINMCLYLYHTKLSRYAHTLKKFGHSSHSKDLGERFHILW